MTTPSHRQPGIDRIRRAMDDARELISWLRSARYGVFLGEAERKAVAFTRESLVPLVQAAGAATYQARVAEWMKQAFLPSRYSDMTERGDRLLEEVLELLQAHGYDPARVATLVQYVYGRPVGEPAQEVGGVMVTLAGFCTSAGQDMYAAGEAELARISRPEVTERIRRKQEAKNALHLDSPLPGNAGGHRQ